jgi:hypothetical protein
MFDKMSETHICNYLEFEVIDGEAGLNGFVLTPTQIGFKYAGEVDMLNVALFGRLAGELRTVFVTKRRGTFGHGRDLFLLTFPARFHKLFIKGLQLLR